MQCEGVVTLVVNLPYIGASRPFLTQIITRLRQGKSPPSAKAKWVEGHLLGDAAPSPCVGVATAPKAARLQLRGKIATYHDPTAIRHVRLFGHPHEPIRAYSTRKNTTTLDGASTTPLTGAIFTSSEAIKLAVEPAALVAIT